MILLATTQPVLAMLRYRQCQLLMLLVFAGYFLVPPAATVIWPPLRGEIFPLSMWSMFYRVHNAVDDFGIRITEIDGQPLQPPLYFEDAEQYFAGSHRVNAYFIVQGLGRAITGEREDKVREQTGLLGQLFLAGHQVNYEVVARSWNPMERYENGSFTRERVLGRFDYDGRGSVDPSRASPPVE